VSEDIDSFHCHVDVLKDKLEDSKRSEAYLYLEDIAVLHGHRQCRGIGAHPY
jgi:hypothetical protein